MERRLIALTLILASIGAPVAAKDMKMPANIGDLDRAAAPPILPQGANSVLSGDPSKEEPYVLRLKLPSGYRIAGYNHPTTEHITVISGNFYIRMGGKLDEKTELRQRVPDSHRPRTRERQEPPTGAWARQGG